MVWLWILAAIVLIFGFVVFRGAPYVPSRKREIDRAFTELYSLDASDVLVDIGSGDGIVLRRAVAHGARAVGYELNPILVVISRWLSRQQKDMIQVNLADFWRVQLPDDVTVVYVFGESRDIVKMANKVHSEATRLGRPLAFISYGFVVPGCDAVKTVGAYHLYELAPLQEGQA